MISRRGIQVAKKLSMAVPWGSGFPAGTLVLNPVWGPVRSPVRTALRPYSAAEPLTRQSLSELSKEPVASTDLVDFQQTKVENLQYSDHNGMPLFLAITERAVEKLNEISKEDGDPNTALELKVESGGCHGFQYLLSLGSTENFDPKSDQSMFVRGTGKVIADKTSLEILRDSKVDYVHELIGSQFKVVDSPYTSSSCGCGASFDFDFEKLASESEEGK
ncbi:unnamed protein product [Kuraishia capsulata CBS 1993]|uniref:Core domain-containing protein n=1 Tax=Kuraishia capsulata CBS 1993 TaxID=1382522 RepID=W6MWD2_9ASCO|nr:uncharacterized protein KUCA_T00003218001 [Kuraishia capsulata CBS 1993]CDK27240.1 unnamed protein product [Kuraishia capsulata CBS 1993]